MCALEFSDVYAEQWTHYSCLYVMSGLVVWNSVLYEVPIKILKNVHVSQVQLRGHHLPSLRTRHGLQCINFAFGLATFS